MGKEGCPGGPRAELAGGVVTGSTVSGEDGSARTWSPQRDAWDPATHVEERGQRGRCNFKTFAGWVREKSKASVRFGEQCVETDPPGSVRSILRTRSGTSMRESSVRAKQLHSAQTSQLSGWVTESTSRRVP